MLSQPLRLLKSLALFFHVNHHSLQRQPATKSIYQDRIKTFHGKLIQRSRRTFASSMMVTNQRCRCCPSSACTILEHMPSWSVQLFVILNLTLISIVGLMKPVKTLVLIQSMELHNRVKFISGKLQPTAEKNNG